MIKRFVYFASKGKYQAETLLENDDLSRKWRNVHKRSSIKLQFYSLLNSSKLVRLLLSTEQNVKQCQMIVNTANGVNRLNKQREALGTNKNL